MPGTKISNAPNGVGQTEINDGSVGTAQLADAPDGVTNQKINDLAVNLRTIAVGATSVGPAADGHENSINLNALAETVIMELVQSAPSRGGFILVLVGINGTVQGRVAGTAADTNQITIRIRMDGTAATADGTVISNTIENATVDQVPAGQPRLSPFCFSVPHLESGAAAGVAHRFKVTAQADNQDLAWFAQGMKLSVIEWA